MMTREQTIAFVTWLLNDENYTTSLISYKLDEWLALNSINTQTDSKNSTIEKAKKLWPTNKIQAIKILAEDGWGLKEAKDYCEKNFNDNTY